MVRGVRACVREQVFGSNDVAAVEVDRTVAARGF
jgi:hypothetical protein